MGEELTSEKGQALNFFTRLVFSGKTLTSELTDCGPNHDQQGSGDIQPTRLLQSQNKGKKTLSFISTFAH